MIIFDKVRDVRKERKKERVPFLYVVKYASIFDLANNNFDIILEMILI